MKGTPLKMRRSVADDMAYEAELRRIVRYHLRKEAPDVPAPPSRGWIFMTAPEPCEDCGGTLDFIHVPSLAEPHFAVCTACNTSQRIILPPGYCQH